MRSAYFAAYCGRGLPVSHHVDIAILGVRDHKLAGRIVLHPAAVQCQRVDAVIAKANVSQPRTGPVRQPDGQRQMVERWPEASIAVHPCSQPRDGSTECLQQQSESAIQFVAKPAASLPLTVSQPERPQPRVLERNRRGNRAVGGWPPIAR